jgi:hypothetical protein
VNWLPAPGLATTPTIRLSAASAGSDHPIFRPERASLQGYQWLGRKGERGYTLVSGGTDNHLILLDRTAQGTGNVLPPVGGQ